MSIYGEYLGIQTHVYRSHRLVRCMLIENTYSHTGCATNAPRYHRNGGVFDIPPRRWRALKAPTPDRNSIFCGLTATWKPEL